MNKFSDDKIFAKKQQQIANFAFDEKVATVFPDMISRSVPGYHSILAMLPIIVENYARENTNLYDLGCSLGASTVAIKQGVKASGCNIIALDNSKQMLDRCRDLLDGMTDKSTSISFVLGDMLYEPIHNASIVVSNFTLQFIEPKQRLGMLKKVCTGLNQGGCLVLSEKLKFADKDQALLENLHWDFKRSNGYSELEISQKRASLEKVLLPETLDEHKERLYAAGFSHVVLWQQSFNFCSLIAAK